MKKFYLLFAVTFCGFTQVNSQSNLLNFDGVNDYVDLGSSALTGVRTIELWFTPAVSITPTSLSDYSELVARNDAAQTDEVVIGFNHSGSGAESGKLVFARNAGGYYIVSSNSNTWTAGVCYHVVGVIDPISGMKMYIDGVLQTDTDPYTLAPGVASETTTIGCHGNTFIRNFNGKIDEVRFWNVARTATEILSTYQYTMGTSTSGLCGYWPFDEGSGTTTIDATVNTANGTISGATWSMSSGVGSCDFIGVNETTPQNEIEINVFPNPVNENSVITFTNLNELDVIISVSDITGKIVYTKSGIQDNQISIGNLINFEAGVYVLNISSTNGTILASKQIMIK